MTEAGPKMIVTIKTLQQKTFKIELDDTENVRYMRELVNVALVPTNYSKSDQYVSSDLPCVSVSKPIFQYVCQRQLSMAAHARNRRALIRNVPFSNTTTHIFHLSHFLR